MDWRLEIKKMMPSSPRYRIGFTVFFLLSMLTLVSGGYFLVKNNRSLSQPNDVSSLTTQETLQDETANTETFPADIALTPTRTRPPRTFFIRPTLAELTPDLGSVPSATIQIAEEVNQSTPYPDPNEPTPNDSTATLTPTITYIVPTPSGEIIPEPALIFIKMIDRENGWGLTQDSVLRTSDGGIDWVDVTPVGLVNSNETLLGIFLNTNQGWVHQPETGKDTGNFYRTEDGGNSWHSGPTPFSEAEIFFLDLQRGWALAYRSTTSSSQAVDIFKTLDGGSSWDKVHEVTPTQVSMPTKIPFSGIKTGIVFKDNQNGWISGVDVNSKQAWLYTSNDGGSTWSQQVLSIPTGTQTEAIITEPPLFFHSKDGLMPVRLTQVSELTVLYITADGGKTWNYTTPVPVTGPISCPSMLSCRVWAGNTFGGTENSGSSWNQWVPNIDLTRTLLQIDFADPLYGYALSLIGSGQNTISTLYFTSDGGNTWNALW